MKILYFANVAAQYRIPFFKAMEENCDIKFVITHQYKDKVIYDFGDNLNNIDRIMFLKKNILIHYIQLIKLLIKEEYDCCMIPPLDSIKEIIDVYIILFIIKIKKKKCVYFWEKWTPNKDYIPIKKRIKNKFQKVCFKIVSKNIDKVLVPGDKSYNYFIHELKYPSEKIKFVIDTSIIQNKDKNKNIREKYNISKESNIILYFGRIIPVKGLDILVKAFSKLSKEFNVTLLICGDGYFKEECEMLSRRLELENIVFTGSIKSEFRYDFFYESDIFVLPSRIYDGNIEAWGLTVAEAMDLGLSCIVSDMVGCSNTLVTDNVNGMIFKNDNVESLYEKLYELITKKELKNNIEKNARLTIINKYNYLNMSKSFINEINDI